MIFSQTVFVIFLDQVCYTLFEKLLVTARTLSVAHQCRTPGYVTKEGSVDKG